MSYNNDLQNAFEIFSINDESFHKLSLEMLKKEYHKKAKLCHPDKVKTNKPNSFQDLQNAYEFLALHKMMYTETPNESYETNVENFYDFVQHMKMFKNKETFRNWLTYWDTKLKFWITMLCKNPKNYIMLQMWFQLLQQYNYIDYLPESLLAHIKMQFNNMDGNCNQTSKQINEQTTEQSSQHSTSEQKTNEVKNNDSKVYSQLHTNLLSKNKKHHLRLEASFTDIMEQNIYKLEYKNNVLFVPLWHHELEYDITIEDEETKEKIKTELCVEIIHQLPPRCALDKDNNLHVFYKLPIKEHVLSSDKIAIYVENYEFTLLNKDIKLLRKQTLLNPNRGPPKINPNDLYNNERAHIYFYIELLAS